MSEADAGTSGSDGSRLGALVATWPRKLAVALVALVGVVAVLYLAGVIGAPSAGLEDRGDWGEVSDERTEIVTTVWVNNPNPVGVSIGDGLTADYVIGLNGVGVAEGSKTGVSVPRGRSTTELRTDLLNDRLSDWWVQFVRANETVTVDANATLRVDAGVSASHPVREQREMLNDSTPVITALSSAADRMNGTHATEVDATEIDEDLLGEDVDPLESGDDTDVTVGYEVRSGWATWGPVTANETTVVFRFEVHNPGDVPVPADPDGVGVAIDMNDVRTFEAESGALSAGDAGTDAVIPSGETREVAFAVTMDNEKVDDWFTSHVRRGERTDVEATFQAVFEVPATGTTVRVPADSPAAYDCDFQTAILEDNQTTDSTCEPPSGPPVGA